MNNGDLISRSALIAQIVNTPSKVIQDAPYEQVWFTRFAARNQEILNEIEAAPAVDTETVFQQMGLVKEALEMAKATLAPAPKWISVKDRLPEIGETVLAFRGDFMEVLVYDKHHGQEDFF